MLKNIYPSILRPFPLLIIFLLTSLSALANIPYLPPPKPPKENPHPAKTFRDKKRVAFAQKAVQLLLVKPLSSETPYHPEFSSLLFTDKDMASLKTMSWLKQDSSFSFANELTEIHQRNGEIVEIRHPHIIPWAFEQFNQHHTFEKKQKSQSTSPLDEGQPSVISEMLAPKLSPDEYMVHIYVRFNKEPGWHHLDVILTEDKEGRLFLRHFFTIPMPRGRAPHFPKGVVC